MGIMRIANKKMKQRRGTIRGVLNDGSGDDALLENTHGDTTIAMNTLLPVSDHEHAAEDKHVKANTYKHKELEKEPNPRQRQRYHIKLTKKPSKQLTFRMNYIYLSKMDN